MTHYRTDDVRIEQGDELLAPMQVMRELPATERSESTTFQARRAVHDILRGADERLLVVVGPCSIHDYAAAVDYAGRLKPAAERLSHDLAIVMRVYFEKPRTTVGWKGFINDPRLDETFDINEGVRLARKLLREINELGVPCGTEFLDLISPQYLADLIAWGAIGARTTESQVHRELASGLSMPVGFKNGTDGTVQVAIDGVRSSAHPHHFMSVTKQGVAAFVSTNGNPDCHVILRGGSQGPNYDAASVQRAVDQLRKDGLPPYVMVDCSHANSGKDHEKQPGVVQIVAEQIANGNRAIFGLMLESFLVGGRQDHDRGKALTYGQSITDRCMSWEHTEPLFTVLAEAARKRRG